MGLLTASDTYKLVDKMSACYNGMLGVTESYAQQTLTISATGGTYTISNGALTTAPLNYNANAAAQIAAIQALANVGNGITVTGTGPYVYQYQNSLAGAVPLLVVNTSNLTGGSASFAMTTAGGYPTSVGDGTFGVSLKAFDFANLITGLYDQGFCDPTVQGQLSTPSVNITTNFTAAKLYNYVFGSFYTSLTNLAQMSRSVNSSIVDLDSFMKWYNWTNGTTYWQCLAPPEWGNAFYALRSSYPSPYNVFFPCRVGQTVLGSTFTNALAKYIQGTGLTTGFSIPNTSASPGYVGGYAFAQWSSGTGSGTCTITVVGQDQNGSAETWTWSGSFAATGTNVSLTPSTHSYSLITSVTSVALTGFSAGTFYIEAHEPSGRTYPSV